MRSRLRQTLFSPLCMLLRSTSYLTWHRLACNIWRQTLMQAMPVFCWVKVFCLMNQICSGAVGVLSRPNRRRCCNLMPSQTLTARHWSRYWVTIPSMLKRQWCLWPQNGGLRLSAPVRDFKPVHNSAGRCWVMPCTYWGCLPWHQGLYSLIGERQEAQILKFNAPPYTLSLSCPSYSKFSQLSYEPGCSRELWCRKCATWLWNKYVLFFSKTLFYTHIQRHTAAAGTKCYKTI